MSDVGDFVERYYDEVGDRLEGMPSLTFVDRPFPPARYWSRADRFTAALGFQPRGSAWFVLNSEDLATQLPQT